MSEPVTTWRPLIGADENSRPEVAHTNEDGARDEFSRLAADHGASAIESEFEDNSFGGPLVADLRTETPIIRGDFADIEAALLRTVGQAVGSAEAKETHQPPAWAFPGLRATREEPDHSEATPFAALSIDGGNVNPDAAEHAAPLLSALRDAALYEHPSAPSDSFILFDDAAISGSAAVADEDKRSRRPLYIMAALVLAGIAGIAATSLRKDGSGEVAQESSKPATIAPVTADNAPAASPMAAPASPAAQQTAAQGAPADAPAQQAAATPDPAQAAAVASATPAGQAAPGQAPRVISMSQPAPVPGSAPLAAPQVAAASPIAAGQAPAAQFPTVQVVPPQVTASHIVAPPQVPPQVATALPAVPPPPGESELATGSILAPPAPDKAQTLAAPSVKAAMAQAKKVKTAAVRPDGSIVKAEAPAKKASSKVAHLKTAHGESVKTAAMGSHAKTADKTAAKAKPAAAHDTQLSQAAPVANPQPAPVQKTASASPGPLSFVNTAVSSITGATGKLFAWGRAAN